MLIINVKLYFIHIIFIKLNSRQKMDNFWSKIRYYFYTKTYDFRVGLPFEYSIFKYPFVNLVKLDIWIWFLYIQIWYEIRISKSYSNIGWDSNIEIVFEYWTRFKYRNRIWISSEIQISKSYSNIKRDSNIEIVFEYRARFEFQISDFW